MGELNLEHIRLAGRLEYVLHREHGGETSRDVYPVVARARPLNLVSDTPDSDEDRLTSGESNNSPSRLVAQPFHNRNPSGGPSPLNAIENLDLTQFGVVSSPVLSELGRNCLLGNP